MAKQTDNKWYSNGLTYEQVKRLEKEYAKIENPTFGLMDKNCLALWFKLQYEKGGITFWQLENPEDIKELLIRTNTSETSQLEGKVVETFCDRGMLRGLSVE